MTVKDNLDESTLATVKEAVAKIVSEELTLEAAASQYSIDESILSVFVEEAQGEKLKDAPKHTNYDDGSEEDDNPKVEGADELKNGSKGSKKGVVKEDFELTDEEIAEEFKDTSDEDLFEAFVTPGMQRYKAAKALMSRLGAKSKKTALSAEEKKKYNDAKSYVDSSDRAGASKKSGGASRKPGNVNEEVSPLELQTKVTKEDIAVDVKEHLDAFFKGEELSEGFRTKVQAIFESAIIATSQKIIDNNVQKLEENLQEQLDVKIAVLEESTEEYKETLNKKVDEYLSYVVEEWVQDNKPAVQSTIRSDLTESFILGLKGLFEEHYIDIPEEKVNIVEDYAKKLDETENEVSNLTEQVIALRKEKQEILKSHIVESASSGLSDNEKERFSVLTENVNYRDIEDFKKAVEDIKESYFGESTTEVSGVEADDTPIQGLNEDVTVSVKENKELPSEVSSAAEYMKRALRSRK